MSRHAIERILEDRKPELGKAGVALETENNFFSVPAADGNEFFLEFRLRDGETTCFSYADLIWFSHNPSEGYLDLDFGGFTVSIKGRGLGTKLFQGVKQKRVAWIKEADSEMQDNPANDTFVELIHIEPPAEKEGAGGDSEQKD